MSEWKLTVGMEVHVELETETKMFCACKNDPFHSAPNTHVCPVCYGLPGALPLLNKAAVAMTVRLGRALHGEIPAESFWARKNYFYPDLPKGYQISQSTAPLVKNATVVIDDQPHRIERIHLEEDAGKLMHAEDRSHSLVDYNRAGVPLMEIVTQPDFTTAESAKRFCQELQRITRSLNISRADMEKGQMRCEANISVSKTDTFGTKVEVKNINSFRAVERAIRYEFDRQVAALESGEKVQQETRTWNDATGETVVMRTKETSADYRYFPEPDLPRITIPTEEAGEHLLPEQQRQILSEIGLPSETLQAVIDKGGFERVREIAESDKPTAITVGKFILSFPEFSSMSVEYQMNLAKAKNELGLGNETVRELLHAAVTEEQLQQELAKLRSEAGSIDLSAVAKTVIEEHAQSVADYRAGKEAALNFLVGQMMAATKGKANIQQVRQTLQSELS